MNQINIGNPRNWLITPKGEDSLARDSVVDEQHNSTVRLRDDADESLQSVELSFYCRNVAVSSYLGALKIAPAFDQVISLGTLDDFPDNPFPEHPGCRRMFFDDVNSATPRELENGAKLAREAHIQEVFAFADKTRSILIHCQAGISRSPAMGILLAWSWGYPLVEILSGMDVRKIFPNRLVLSLGEKVLQLDPGTITDPMVQRLARGAPANPPLPRFKLHTDGVYRIASI